MTTWKDWATTTTEGVASTVKARRTLLGVTAADLAERTSIGKPLTRAVISDIETGRKKTLDISELVTLAAALDTTPLALLFPDVLADIEVLPGVMVPGIDVFAWWTGVGGVTDDSARDRFSKDDGIRIASQLVDVEKVLRLNRVGLRSAEHSYKLFEHDAERERAERARDRIEMLETERLRLMDLYRKTIEGQPSDA